MRRLPHDPYYRDRLSEYELCNDFPADEIFIDGLHAMQHHLWNNNVNLEIPVVRVMNTAHYIAAYMFATTCSGDQMEYEIMAYDSLSRDKQLTRVTMIVLAAMLQRTEGFRARNCRNLILNNRDSDFEEGVTLYDQFLRNADKHFAEEDFLLDTHTQIILQQEEIARLTSENIQLKYTLTKMENDKPQTIVYNYGTYNDIHDNPYSNIYTATPADEPKKEQAVQEDSSLKEQAYTPAIPNEGDYNEVREYITLRKKYDEDFRVYWDGHTLKQNCIYLTKEFGWVVDEHSLGANLNRHR